MKKVTLTINGKSVTAPEGRGLLWVALDNGFYIPNLCAIRGGNKPAACRLCFVEVAGKAQPVTACTESVFNGMVVNTQGEKSLHLARVGFELLMASHPVVCAQCSASNCSCELQRIARHLGVGLKTKHLRKLTHELPLDDSHPLFLYDPNKCVLCGRCVWVCRQKMGNGIIGFAHRGFNRVVSTFAGEPLGESKCMECGECIAVCPAGALTFKDGKAAQLQCSYQRQESLKKE